MAHLVVSHLDRFRWMENILADTRLTSLQYGADIETIRRALCRDSLGRASGPLGAALDLIAAEEGSQTTA
jgi:hypothetical protein